MAKKTLKNLALEHDFEEENEYLDYIVESLINGNRTQCKELYNAMKAEDKKNFIEYHIKENKFEDELKKLLIKY